MFFTRIGKFIAHLIFWLGLFRVAMGFVVAFGSADMESNRALASAIFGGKMPGQAIDQGFIAIVLGVALGVLCEISANRNKPE